MHTGTKEQRIAIIGSSSFLASYFIKYYEKDTLVTLHLYGSYEPEMQSDRFATYKYKLPDAPLDYSNLLEMDLIINCAGMGIQAVQQNSSDLLYQLNVMEPIRILNFLKENQYKGTWMSFGSYFEIGSHTNELKFHTEAEVLKSEYAVPNDYCISKRLLNRFMDSSTFSFTYYHFILSTIYGKGEQEHRLLPLIISKLKRNEPVELSSGSQIRQYIHASKAVGLISKLYENNVPSGAYNIATAHSISIKELASQIARHLKAEELLHFGSVQRQDLTMQVLQLDIHKTASYAEVPEDLSIEEIIQDYIN